MRKLINLIEGAEQPDLFADDDEIREPKPRFGLPVIVNPDPSDFVGQVEKIFHDAHEKLLARRQVEDVYLLVLDDFPFEDAVSQVAKRDNMDPLDLRAACVDDYKILRSQSDTYASYSGTKLVHALNPIIREAIERSL